MALTIEWPMDSGGPFLIVKSNQTSPRSRYQQIDKIKSRDLFAGGAKFSSPAATKDNARLAAWLKATKSSYLPTLSHTRSEPFYDLPSLAHNGMERSNPGVSEFEPFSSR